MSSKYGLIFPSSVGCLGAMLACSVCCCASFLPDELSPSRSTRASQHRFLLHLGDDFSPSRSLSIPPLFAFALLVLSVSAVVSASLSYVVQHLRWTRHRRNQGLRTTILTSELRKMRRSKRSGKRTMFLLYCIILTRKHLGRPLTPQNSAESVAIHTL